MNKLSYVVLLMCITISACAPRLETTMEVENPGSPLLGILMQQGDFDGKFIPKVELVKQSEHIPDNQNKSLIETASHVFSGDYNNKYPLTIDNKLSFYSKKLDWVETVNIQPEQDEKPLILPLNSIQSNMMYRCYSNEIIVRCEVVMQYEFLISRFGLYYSHAISEAEITSFLDSLILNIDHRIAELPYASSPNPNQ